MGTTNEIMLYDDDFARLDEIKKFIDENLAGNLHLENLSQRFSISTATLRRHFRSIYKESITDYIRQCRMKQAMILTMNHSFPVGQIAITVGYNDRTAFTRAFKKSFGKTPFAILRNGLGGC